MQCPTCKANPMLRKPRKLITVDSRESYGSMQRRRRYCDTCEERFTTYELFREDLDFVRKDEPDGEEE